MQHKRDERSERQWPILPTTSRLKRAWATRLRDNQRNIIDKHIGIVGASIRILVIEELDANGLTRVRGKIEVHLHPRLVVGRGPEQAL